MMICKNRIQRVEYETAVICESKQNSYGARGGIV